MNGRNVIIDHFAAKIQAAAHNSFLSPKLIFWICGPSGCGKTYMAK